ncbi:hypothetical protein DNTS_011041 [Danionella cerebrum]|uniref:ZP domain-containing protein n=3 Tax=Danionella cerebrum TaxID=2873325 RepID=A0A553MTY3_9TELE|nr:hypothetical protein DNTS_011041 [Danionella translucida]
MNIQMPENCVNSGYFNPCNTITSLRLNGPHPQIEDGVVTREVCGDFMGDCCAYKSYPIRVKACPGHYYVYELVAPALMYAGYCTDISSISDQSSLVSPGITTQPSITFQDYEPCENYNILDNNWRSTLSAELGEIHDDTRVEWHGWYRLFINGSSAQMPDWCTTYMTCGGYSPLWLYGSHPQLEDGVVTREIYGSQFRDCSHYRSNPIQVKACTGNFYVYKFTRPAVSIIAPVYCAVPITTPSVDPCYNYESLDEPWRSTNNSLAHNTCDFNLQWNGWYRLFYNGANARMPDSCVNQGLCGTNDPLWLNGPHPELEDGVVTRQVCISSWGGCCTYTSHSIQVKACPGDYYVYEIVQPLTCSAYCVEDANPTMASTSIPSTESITLPVTTSAPPLDPCYNYNVLDDRWRATTNRYSSLTCDAWVSWSGWYRLFIQGQSVQMPDTCVPENSCGTDAPLWLSGGHPAVEDGVVTRDVCGHWNNDCCYFQSNPIQVKACPGGYYVYEFVPTPFCYTAYCAESSSEALTMETTTMETTPELSTTEAVDRNPCSDLNCSEEERCGMKDGVFGCLCKVDPHRRRSRSDSFDFSETCESSSGFMSVSRCQLFEAGFTAENLHLNDPSCTGTPRNGRVEFNFDNDEHICGTTLTVSILSRCYLLLYNFVLGTPKGKGLISREKILKLSFSCVYHQTQTLSMNMEINPLESVVSLPGEGRYQVRMIPYEDEEFTQPFTGQVEAELDQEMHVEVRVEGVDSHQFALVMDACWATPVNEADYSLRWDLITDQCPNPNDKTVRVLQNSNSTSSRFSFRMFLFTADSAKLYLHCAVHLCLLSSERCSSSCSSEHHRRQRRSLEIHDSTSLSLGPLMASRGNTGPSIADKVVVSEASCLCRALMLLFAPLMSFLTIF